MVTSIYAVSTCGGGIAWHGGWSTHHCYYDYSLCVEVIGVVQEQVLKLGVLCYYYY